LIEVASTPSLSGVNIIMSFNSLADCAKYLEIPTSTLQYRIKKSKSFRFDNKLVEIKKVETLN
jgi:hypothetical protein